jgi:hypothetical protein
MYVCCLHVATIVDFLFNLYLFKSCMDISAVPAPTVVFGASCNTIIIDQQQRKGTTIGPHDFQGLDWTTLGQSIKSKCNYNECDP